MFSKVRSAAAFVVAIARDSKGSSTIQYAIVVALVALASVKALGSLGLSLSSTTTDTTSKLANYTATSNTTSSTSTGGSTTTGGGSSTSSSGGGGGSSTSGGTNASSNGGGGPDVPAPAMAPTPDEPPVAAMGTVQ